ncbi:MAG: hypothetical protein SWK90_18260 [Chloroflexota bacterium]|nr:hypothetical protein [Chloroflexota bacterium]
MTNQPTNQSTNKPTVEAALWVLVAVVALALRLTHLDAAPLSGPEARQALLAWRAVAGQGRPEADYSPLLFAANALLFTLWGAGDGLARLWPALFGSGLALTPFLFRRRLGRVGALAAGLYLALSPAALLASRQLDGAVVAAVGGMVFLGGLICFFDTGISRWLTLSAGGLALAVTASSAAYGLLLVLGLAWLILSWIWPAGEADWPPPRWPSFILYCSLFALALSTGLGWNPTGLGATGDLLLAWFARFGPASDPAISPFILVAAYEPLALSFGLGGLVWAVRRGHRFGKLLGLWAGLAILLLMVMPGRAPLDVLWVVLPLALLTGSTVQALGQSLQARGSWLSEGLYVPLVLVLWAHCYLVLTRYGESGDSVDLALAALAVALQVLLAVTFALLTQPGVALRGAAVGTGVALLLLTLAAGWGGAHVRPASPQELLVRHPTAMEVHDLVRTLRDLSWRETGVPTRLPVTFEAAPDSILAWYLRDFSAARRVERLVSTEEADQVVVTAWSGQDGAGNSVPTLPGDNGEYIGQDFALRRSWDRREIACIWEWPPRCNAAVRWLLLRRTPSPPVADEWAVLWLRQEQD